MIQSKKINIIVAIFVVFALIISIAFIIFGNIQKSEEGIKTEVEYESKIFETDIISIEILVDEKNWQEMFDNAINEQYTMVDVIVNGTKFQNVGIRPKGNSSLSHVVNSESDRYSFRLKFDEYIKEQTCFGLESFVVNNIFKDNTYMKEFISYELMEEIGVNAPKFGYADIKVNGENWGFYLAVELYNKSYEQRVFGDTSGMLYNVKKVGRDSENINKQANEQKDTMQHIPEMNLHPNLSSRPSPNNDNARPPLQMNGKNNNLNKKPFLKGEQNSLGGSLEYTDNNIESYSSIFGNVVGKGTESDFQRVVEAFKALSEEEELEKYYDVDQILRYLAAHTIVVNLDSYSSNMAQNYYIYERDGQITILPWDYNQSWGGFQNNSVSSVVNFPIDTPLSGVEMSSRPLIEKLFTNTEYLERYHSYLQKLLDDYFSNGKFEEKINSIDDLISDYVEKDPTAFCSYEEYKTAISAFINLGNLRAESVQGQLNGTVPSTTIEQTKNADSLIATADLNLASLTGTMSVKDGEKGNPPMGVNNRINAELQSKAMEIIREKKGEITDEVRDELISLGLTIEQIEEFQTMNSGKLAPRGEKNEQRDSPKNIQNKISDNKSNLNAPVEQELDYNKLILASVLLLVLTFGLLFALKFEKKY